MLIIVFNFSSIKVYLINNITNIIDDFPQVNVNVQLVTLNIKVIKQ